MPKYEASVYKRYSRRFHAQFSKFGHDLKLAMSCLTSEEARDAYAEKTGWSSYDIRNAAIAFRRQMGLRKEFVWTYPHKLYLTKAIIEAKQEPAITFWQTTDMADAMSELMTHSVSYHSKIKAKDKKSAINRFNHWNSKVRCINTANALDEGFDIPNIKLGVEGAYTSTDRQYIQRLGRCLRRTSEDALAEFYVLYIKGTQEEKWLSERITNNGREIWMNENELMHHLHPKVNFKQK